MIGEFNRPRLVARDRWARHSRCQGEKSVFATTAGECSEAGVLLYLKMSQNYINTYVLPSAQLGITTVELQKYC